MAKISTKEKIIQTADQLFYENGFDHTSFADVAVKVGISRGNFYHHFKSKDEILSAVIEYRKESTKQMIEDWELESDNPKSRILCYINILIVNQTLIREFGCPVGTLSNELSKLNHAAKEDASSIFTLFHQWLSQQFSELGFKSEAEELSMHVLSWSQGTATMFNTFHDEGFLEREINQIKKWLNKKIMET